MERIRFDKFEGQVKERDSFGRPSVCKNPADQPTARVFILDDVDEVKLVENYRHDEANCEGHAKQANCKIVVVRALSRFNDSDSDHRKYDEEEQSRDQTEIIHNYSPFPQIQLFDGHM